MKKNLFIIAAIFLFSIYSFGMGADAAYPILEKMFAEMPIPEYTVYTVSDQDMTVILNKAADLDINLFELLDCIYRYLAPNKKRLEISGTVLRNAQTLFSYGDPIEYLLPIEKLIKIQVGACFTKEQKALDMQLVSSYSTYIKIATALYDTQCGFAKLEPLNFLEPYGMHVKKWNIEKPIRKIQLYAPGQGAIYAVGFFRPKKYYLDSVTRLTMQK